MDIVEPSGFNPAKAQIEINMALDDLGNTLRQRSAEKTQQRIDDWHKEEYNDCNYSSAPYVKSSLTNLQKLSEPLT